MFPTVHDHARDKQVGRECVCVSRRASVQLNPQVFVFNIIGFIVQYLQAAEYPSVC